MAEFARDTTAEHAFAEHEHRDLAPGINRIHDVARLIDDIASPTALVALLDVIDWVDAVLRPHVAWEDAWLYPEIARRAGTPWATKLMTFEHRQILDVARRLVADRALLRREPLRHETNELRSDLFGLEALLRAHIEREERFLIPLLEVHLAEVSR
ncbi:MAG TPA: hemerythrin domain-containing protein [Verrucomicrobiae bacterium]|jgi:hemerythrin-like domain-containing protein|nr:hemerythrin domain-containing protein [Verrucomicrobiae bacterium]